jgi:hypothetical protein
MVSFAKVPGAGSSAPVANAEVVDEDKKTATASTAVAERPAYVSTFSTGTEDDEPLDEGSKVRYPYLNLVQPTSKDIKAVAPEGNFVLNKTVKIVPGTRAVVVGFGKTFYREKTDWKDKDEARTLYSLADVVAAGGTPNWRESDQNAKKNGGSQKPWFASCIKALLLVEKPEGADEAFFPHVVGDKCYAACMFEAKSTAYDSFYIELNSKRKTTNLFKSGWAGRFIALNSVKGKGDDASYKPVPQVLEAAPAEFAEIAKSIASGN